jgi:3',5'-cyclic AMP phosphodiesterase CpdA
MDDRSVRLVQFTDTHLLTDPQGTLRGARTLPRLQACLDHARRHFFPADAVVVTGDLVHDEPAAYAMASLLALELHAAGGRRLQPGDDPQQRGLAAPARTDDAHELVRIHRQRHVGQRDHPPALAGEGVADALAGEVARAHGRRVRRALRRRGGDGHALTTRHAIPP